MRHVLLAVATIGAVTALALSPSSKPVSASGNPQVTPTSYRYSSQDGMPSAATANADQPAVVTPETLAAHDLANGWIEAAAAHEPTGEIVGPLDERLQQPAAAFDGEAGTPREHVEQVRRGDTLMTVLTRAGVPTPDAHDAVQALTSIYNPRALRPGQEVKLTFGPGQSDDGDLKAVALQASIERDVAVRRTESGEFASQETGRALKQSLGRAGALVDSSLFKAGTNAGVPVEIMFELIRAFSYDVDFQRDLQPGDSFEVLFEQTHDARGRLVRTGQMLYAALSLSGNLLELYRYEPRDGTPDYYNPKGESVRKALLRTPVDGAKLTSGFGMRNHPILGYSRMHQGVDFGAPTGTPIMAAGDGVIAQLGGHAGYGNYVRIRHNSDYSTAYAHMSRYAPGMHPGVHVHQGQVIGFVGMTGLATGPHLHYEVLVHEHQINPMSIKVPSGRQLAGPELRRFNTAVADIDRKLHVLPDPFAVATSAQPTSAAQP